MSQGPVPTRAEFLLRVAKPEAFSQDLIPQPTVEAALADATDRAAAYYGDRATLPLVAACGGFKRAVCALAALEIIASRGFARNAGADAEYVNAAERATKWLESVAAKTIQPYFVDSSARVEDSVLVATSERSEDWTRTDTLGIPREVP